MAKKSVIGIPPSRLKKCLERYRKQLNKVVSLTCEIKIECTNLESATTLEEAFAIVKELMFHEGLIAESLYAMSIVNDALYDTLAHKLFKDKI